MFLIGYFVICFAQPKITSYIFYKLGDTEKEAELSGRVVLAYLWYKTLKEFKSKIRNLKSDKCLCRLCKTYTKDTWFFIIYMGEPKYIDSNMDLNNAPEKALFVPSCSFLFRLLFLRFRIIV